MSYDRRLIAFTSGHEGFVSRYYLDPTGTPTIGYGFTWASRIFRDWWMTRHGRKFRKGDTISKSDAQMLLMRLIDAEYAPAPLAKFPKASAHAKAAGVDMCFNCGPGALKWKWAAALAGGDVRSAARRMRVTATTSRGRKLAGLVRRRKEAGDIMEFNRWPARITEIKLPVPAVVSWMLGEEDIAEAQRILKSLGYELAATGRLDAKTEAATRAFQQSHPQLKADGILGTATFAALQRVRNLRQEAACGGGATAMPAAAAGGGEIFADPAWWTDWVLWGGLGALAIGAAYLAWFYRDEIKIGLGKL